MRTFIALDGGTTNTRLYLIQDGKILDTLGFPVGAACNAKQPGALADAVSKGIRVLLGRHGILEEVVEGILASGMVTSEMGLYALPHLVAPVSLAALTAGVARVSLPDISPIPFCFVPGVKTEGADLSSLDMMRGEETELVGLFGTIPPRAVVLLPGSHSKIVATDAQGRIAAIKTMLTGEMISVLSGETVLRGSFSLAEAALVPQALAEGFAYAEQNGLTDALFKVRVLKTRCGYDADRLYSFFLGALLREEVNACLRLDADRIYIGGRRQIKEALTLLLTPRARGEVIALDDDLVAESTARGLLTVCGA